MTPNKLGNEVRQSLALIVMFAVGEAPLVLKTMALAPAL